MKPSLRRGQIPKLTIVEIDNYAQICTPPPAFAEKYRPSIPLPSGKMKVCATELKEVDESKKEQKEESVDKAVPTGLKRKRMKEEK